jgi:hypothetical protein
MQKRGLPFINKQNTVILHISGKSLYFFVFSHKKAIPLKGIAFYL